MMVWRLVVLLSSQFNDIHNLVKVRPDVGSAAVYSREITPERVNKVNPTAKWVCGSYPKELE